MTFSEIATKFNKALYDVDKLGSKYLWAIQDELEKAENVCRETGSSVQEYEKYIRELTELNNKVQDFLLSIDEYRREV